MMNNWNDYRSALHAKVGEYAELTPDTMRAFSALNAAASHTKRLDAKTHELIALAVSVTTRCDGCITSHVKAAAEAGATREEIAEALSTAIALNAGAALVYTARTLDAFDALAAK